MLIRMFKPNSITRITTTEKMSPRRIVKQHQIISTLKDTTLIYMRIRKMLMLIEKLNQTNLDKLTLRKRLKIRENFWKLKLETLHPKVSIGNWLKVIVKLIKNYSSILPNFLFTYSVEALTRGYTEYRNTNKSTPNGKNVKLKVINDIIF